MPVQAIAFTFLMQQQHKKDWLFFLCCAGSHATASAAVWGWVQVENLNSDGREIFHMFMPTYFLLHLWLISTSDQPQQPKSTVRELQASPVNLVRSEP